MAKPYSTYINTWRLDKTLLNNEWVIEKIRGEIEQFLDLNEKNDTAYQNFWDTMNIGALRGYLIAMSI